MKYKYEKDKLQEVVNDSLSISEVCRRLNMKPVGGNFKTMKKYFKLHEIDTSHFTGKAWNVGDRYRNFGKRYTLDEILIKNSTYTSIGLLKRRLIEEGLKEYKCEGENCGINEWHGKKITLHLDHINGDNLDHRIENLRFLCPNCHSQTPTYGSKNTKKSSKNYLKESRYLKHKRKTKINYCKCGKLIDNRSDMCEDCYRISIRKVERPSYELLKKEVNDTNYCAVGRKYGVSDNAIRKWIKQYET